MLILAILQAEVISWSQSKSSETGWQKSKAAGRREGRILAGPNGLCRSCPGTGSQRRANAERQLFPGRVVKPPLVYCKAPWPKTARKGTCQGVTPTRGVHTQFTPWQTHFSKTNVFSHANLLLRVFGFQHYWILITPDEISRSDAYSAPREVTNRCSDNFIFYSSVCLFPLLYSKTPNSLNTVQVGDIDHFKVSFSKWFKPSYES